jgi:hypothetical protein
MRSPLFDIYDPDGTLEEQARLGLLMDEEDEFGIRRPKKRASVSDLMPEEEKGGLLNTLSQAGSSGLSWAGYLLDTPGALIRGTLAGDPLSVFGSSDERVSGRDLLRQYGMAGEEDTWGNFGGGFAAEAILDPLTYASLGLSLLGKGAASQAGKAVAAAGLLRNEALDSVTRVNRLRQARGLPAYQDAIPTPRVREAGRLATPRSVLDEIADPAAQPWTQQAAAARQAAEARVQQQMERFGATDMDAPLRVLDNFRIPGTNIGFELGGGQLGDALARGFDRAGDFTKRAPLIGNVTRTGAALFSKDAGGLPTLSNDLDLTNEAQLASRMAKAGARDRAETLLRDYTRLQLNARRAQVPDVVPSGAAAGQAIPEGLRSFEGQPLWNALMDYVEAPRLPGPTLTGAQGYKSTGDEVSDWVLENVPEFRAIRDRFEQLGPNARAAAQAAGLPTQYAQSRGVGGFLPRQLRFFERPSPPDIPGGAPYESRNWGRDERAFSVADNFGRSRDPAYDLAGGARAFRYLTGNVDPSIVDSAALQQGLIGADQATSRALIDQALDALGQADPIAFTRGGSARPFDYVLDDLYQSQRFQQAGRPMPAGQMGPAPLSRRQRAMRTRAEGDIAGRYDRLSNLVRTADTQFAEQGVGIFDTPSWNNALRYEMGQATNQANAEQLVAMMARRAANVPATTVAGGVNVPLQQAARELGFDPRSFRQVWQNQVGGDVTNYSIPRRMVEAMKTLSPETRLAAPERGLVNILDQFTSGFKVGALASPAFHVRNAYSGAYNAAAVGAFNPMDYIAAWQASQGNTGLLGRRLVRDRTSPYFGMNPEDAAREFLVETGAQRVSTGNVLSDVSGIDDAASVRGLYTGASNEPSVGGAARELLTGRTGRSWPEFANDFFSLRGVGITQPARSRNTNPLLVLNDSVGQSVEDMLRTGTFLNQTRKGVDPGVAGDTARLTQLDYSPESFTGFERNFMKRLMPFYSFQRRILPSIADNIINRPGGLQGQTIRAITRASEPNEDNFVPEHLRQSAAIPLPDDWPSILGGSPGEGLQRYITNIDLPFESTLNMFTPGVGATVTSRIADAAAKTGSNILGQTSPLLKAPLEYITNRQLYTGREMSDLYSVLEQDLGPIGRPLEQAVVNFVPFGARGLSLYRQLNDDRLSPVDAKMKAAFNILAGVKLTDVDEERTKRLAAREMLNKILETTPGVRTYENLTVPDDALATMPEEQRRLYLLYRVLQSDAAKRARQRKAADPMDILLNQ